MNIHDLLGMSSVGYPLGVALNGKPKANREPFLETRQKPGVPVENLGT